MRIAYLDHLRAVCMIFVVVLHAYYLIDYAPAALYAVFVYNFAMGTFFMISGYVLMQQLPESTGPYLIGRIKRLAWPLATGLLLVNPLTLAVIHDGFSAQWWTDVAERALNGRLFVHLWFLFSLILFVAFVPLFLRLLKHTFWPKFAAHVPERHGATALTFGAVTVQAVVAAGIGLDLPVPLDGLTKYTWCFAAGLAFYLYPRAWEAAHRPGPLPFVIAAFFWLAMLDGWADQGTIAHQMLHAARLASSTCALSFGMLWLFRTAFNQSTAFWRFISEGALTTYILQWLVLHSLLAPLMWVGLRDGALFWALIACTLAIKLPFHHLVVARVPILMLLLNGTPLAQARPAAQPSSS